MGCLKLRLKEKVISLYNHEPYKKIIIQIAHGCVFDLFALGRRIEYNLQPRAGQAPYFESQFAGGCF